MAKLSDTVEPRSAPGGAGAPAAGTDDSLDHIRRQLGDRYAIERELGRGGMGAVYLARDLRLDRSVALKVLPADLASDGALRERFLRETRTAASFSHPNIVPVHAVEDRDGVLAFAMGLVEGESLAERVRRAGPLDTRGMVRLLQDVGYALAYAHGRGVVHRDIKPDNIMLERATGRALLMDFGISRPITTPVNTAGLTRVGEVVGTPEYMSPEQASGDMVDGRSDLYSLGLVALYALTGQPPITGASTQQIIVKQLTELPPSAVTLRPGLPGALGDAIDRCVAKAPDERFATAESLVEAIDDAQLSVPEIPVPIRLFAQEAATLGLILVFLSVISWLLLRSLRDDVGTAWAALPGVILFAIAATRALQASAAARRLAIGGFDRDEVMSGLQAIADEREGVRQALRADPDTRRRRRITIVMAVAQLVTGALIVAATLDVDVRWVGFGSNASIDSTGEPTRATPGNVVAAATGFSLIGIGFLLLARSPFRMPIGERLFRLFWLGAPGRAFLRLSMRNRGRIRGSSGARSRVVSGISAPPAGAAVPSLSALEARVRELERWRDASHRR